MGENFAAEYLIKHGVNIISKNYRVRSGEIDIIGLDKGILVFYEVKTRRGTSYGTPAESVTRFKQTHIKNTAIVFIHQNKPRFNGIRFDVIEIILDGNFNVKEIKQIVNAF